MRLGLPALVWLVFLLSWAQTPKGVEAVLVLVEDAIEGGRLLTYTGSRRYPVASEKELLRLIQDLARPPAPPRFILQGGVWRGVEKKGLSFDREEALKAYREALAQGQTAFRLPVRYTPPSPSLRELYALGVREHLATGETGFRGSSRARVHNLTLAARRLDGLLIPQGALFSFNQALGPVDEETGYREAFVILGDRTEQGVGGGVCQVSTTLYRAFLRAGLPIRERHPHSYQVAYYRPTGMDAAVYAPYKDLKALNDTPGAIWVQSSVQGTTLRFHLFGRKDREVELLGPYIRERTPPLPPREILDPSLPPGTRRQVDFAAEGAWVEVVRRVRYRDGRTREDRFTSRYRPWGAVYQVGPSPDGAPKAPPDPPAAGRGAP